MDEVNLIMKIKEIHIFQKPIEECIDMKVDGCQITHHHSILLQEILLMQ